MLAKFPILFFVIFSVYFSCTQSLATEAEKICFINSYQEMYDFKYRVDLRIKNDQQGALAALLDAISGSQIKEEIKELRTFLESSKPVNNMRTLQDRIDADIDTIYKKIYHMGFYAAEVQSSIDVKNNKYAKVQININTGKIFQIKLDLKLANRDDEFNKKYREIFNQQLYTYTSSMTDIRQLINDVIHKLQSDGYYNPKIMEKKIHIDHDANAAILTLIIDPQERVVFSHTKIDAFPGIREKFIQNRISWKEGETFDIKKLKQTQDSLQETQIFSDVNVKPINEKAEKGAVPIQISVEEDKKHAIDFALLYSAARNNNFKKTSASNKQLKSIVARLSWTRNNAFGAGERLRFTIEGTPKKTGNDKRDYAFEMFLMQPDVFIKNLHVEYQYIRRQELKNIFSRRQDRVAIILNYPMWIFTDIRAGCYLEKNHIDGDDLFFAESDENKQYKNITIPLEMVIDKTDDLLNPTKGYRASAKFQYIKFNRATLKTLLHTDLNFSYNHSLDQQRKTVLALNCSKKILFGQDIDDIPIDRRIYAGGMNSVRGYANQLATERVLNANTHMGGKSSVEFKAEMRRKLSRDFGGVLFFDGAKVSGNNSKFEKLQTEKKRWFLSYGIGIRYFTNIGPIRIDFAFPIKKRRGVDSTMQFILSLGQSF